MPKNHKPKTATIGVMGSQLTINQNGRVLHGVRTPQQASALIDAGYVSKDGGMLFVSLALLAKAFGL